MTNTLDKVQCRLDILNSRLDMLKGLVKSCEFVIVEEHRKKWWLEHPEVAYFTARTSWQTDFGHSEWEQELSFYVFTVIGVDGLEIDFRATPLYFVNYPALEEEVVDDYDGEITTYRNPFLCT